jgi:hypothetical protein
MPNKFSFNKETDVMVADLTTFFDKFLKEVMTEMRLRGAPRLPNEFNAAVESVAQKYNATSFYKIDDINSHYCLRFPSNKDKLLFLLKNV